MQRRRISEGSLYRQLAGILRARITSGEWGPGRNLPSEADLGHEYEVSQATVRRALAILRREGRIVRRLGQVAAVAESREPTIVRINQEESGRIYFQAATPEEQEEFGLDDGGFVMVVEKDGEEPQVLAVPGTEIRFGSSRAT